MRILITKNGHDHYDESGEVIDVLVDTAGKPMVVELDSGQTTTIVETEFKIIRPAS